MTCSQSQSISRWRKFSRNWNRLWSGLKRYAELLTPEISQQDFASILKMLEDINPLKSKVEGYADLAFAEDTQSPAVLNLRDRVDQLLTDLGNRALFFEFWFKELSDEAAHRLTEHSGDLRYFLERMRRFKPFTLTELEEKMINLKDVNGIDAMVNLYEMITNQFKFKLEIDGKTETLTRDQLSSFFQNPSPEVRARAYQELYRVYIQNSTVLAQMYIHKARDWHTEGIELRGFFSPISHATWKTTCPMKWLRHFFRFAARMRMCFSVISNSRLAGWDSLRENCAVMIFMPHWPPR